MRASQCVQFVFAVVLCGFGPLAQIAHAENDPYIDLTSPSSIQASGGMITAGGTVKGTTGLNDPFVQAKLYAADGMGNPTGNPLSTGTVAVSLLNGSQNWSISLTAPTSTAGTKFVISYALMQYVGGTPTQVTGGNQTVTSY